jgi:hypothetical protein
MKRMTPFVWCAVVCVVLMGSARVWANTTVVQAPPPGHFENGDQIYDGGSKGFERMFKDATQGKPDMKDLYLEAKSIRNRDLTSRWIMWGGAGVGLGVMMVGALTVKVDNLSSSMTMMAVGGGIGLTGLIVGWILMPGRDDYLDLINDYNRRSKDTKMKLQLGLSPFGASLAYNF